MKKFFSGSSSARAKRAYKNIKIKRQGKQFSLGEFNTYHLSSDPKRLGFLFARYKFVAKMLEGYGRVLEIGCQEGLGSLLVAQAVGKLVAVDFYRPHIESCLKKLKGFAGNIEFRGHDIIKGPVAENFSGTYSLDVLEHIDPKQEGVYMANVSLSLQGQGVFIIGMPSLESQKYASSASKAGHINCKSGEALRTFCQRYFHNIFMFGMNDEVVHTGFLPMAHYLLALCVNPRRAAGR